MKKAKISWNQDIELELIENVSPSISGDGDEIRTKDRIFKKDEISEIEIIDENTNFNTYNVIFVDDDTCVFGLSEEFFTFIERE